MNIFNNYDMHHIYDVVKKEFKNPANKDKSLSLFGKINSILRSNFGQTFYDDSTYILGNTIYRFIDSGKRTFKIPDNLFKLFQYTHLKKVYPDFIKFPFNCFSLRLPANQNVFLSYNGDKITQIYAFIEELTEGLYKEFVKTRFEINTPEYVLKVKKTIVFTIMTDSDSSFVYTLPLNENEDLFKQFDNVENDISVRVDPNYTKNKYYFYKQFLSLFFNTVLYINTPNSYAKEKTNIDRIKKIKRKRQKDIIKKQDNIYRLKDIPLSPFEQKQFFQNNNVGKEYEKHTKAWLVRGHWRNQAKGKNRKERELIWIRPFIKGDDTVSKKLLERNYILKDTDKDDED